MKQEEKIGNLRNNLVDNSHKTPQWKYVHASDAAKTGQETIIGLGKEIIEFDGKKYRRIILANEFGPDATIAYDKF